LEYLNSQIPIVNFYCVKNKTTKDDATADFDKYCELRDSEKSFFLYKNVLGDGLTKKTTLDMGREFPYIGQT